MNMLVILIIAIVIFTSGIYLLYTIYEKSIDFQERTDEQLDKQMESILCDKPVCLSSSYKKMFRGDFKVVGLRIYNNLKSEETFRVTTSLNKVFNQSDHEITSQAQDKINILPESCPKKIIPSLSLISDKIFFLALNVSLRFMSKAVVTAK